MGAIKSETPTGMFLRQDTVMLRAGKTEDRKVQSEYDRGGDLPAQYFWSGFDLLQKDLWGEAVEVEERGCDAVDPFPDFGNSGAAGQ